jgi:hypothetical protein
MNHSLRVLAAVLLLAGLAALPAAAQTIPPGEDRWVTPNNGQTYFTFVDGDVEHLCGKAPSSGWNHQVALRGVPVAGSDWDTSVRRIDPATFDTTGHASTRIVVTRLEFASTAPQETPCGNLTWRVSLAGSQATTKMDLRLTSSKGGLFAADIAVNVVFRAFTASGALLGTLTYNMILPDPATGTPWSFGPGGQFRPGITPADDCIAVLREKLSTYTPDSSHYYFITDLIAQGKCYRQG